MQEIEVGFIESVFLYDKSVAYTMLIGIGTAGAVLMNMIVFGESKSMLHIICLAAILFGGVGLKAIS